jgi:hypothetical protein
MSGTLNMGANTITNIGNSGTDFDSSGGLTLAAPLVLPNGSVSATALRFSSGGANNGLYYSSGTRLAASGTNTTSFGATLTQAGQLDLANASGAYLTVSGGAVTSRVGLKVATTQTSALSGASVATTGTFIPANAMVVGVTCRVTTTITGASSFDIGLSGGDTDQWGNDVALTSGTTTTFANHQAAWTPTVYPSGGEVLLTANTSNFTGGVVRINLYYFDLSAPSS